MRTLLLLFVSGSLVACHAHDHDTAEVPAQYAGSVNPFAGDTAAAAAGASLYAEHCTECHADDGRGDAQAIEELVPPPPDFHDHTLEHPDDYLFWRISEGGSGDPVVSAMPAWSEMLSDDEIWQLVTHLRTMQDR